MVGCDQVLGAGILDSNNSILRQLFTSVKMGKHQPFKRQSLEDGLPVYLG